MRKIFSALLIALFATATMAQTYPSPTFNNVTVQGNVNLPSKPASSVFMAPAAGGVPAFRTLDEVDLPALAVAKITGLQAALDGKAAAVHTHGAADISSGTLADARIPSLAISKTTGLQAALDAKAPLASPALTGVPTAPTAALATNTTQIATTAFVMANQGTPSYGSQTANTVLAAPDGSAGTPAFRALSTTDIPNLSTSKITSGTFAGSIIGSGTVAETYLPSNYLSKHSLGLPLDFWTSSAGNYVNAGPYGWVGHNGSNATTIANNYYRNTTAGQSTVGAGGTGASGIDLYPNGFIYFRQAATFDGNAINPPVTYQLSPTVPARGDRGPNLASTAFVQENKGSVDPIDYGATCGGAVSATTAFNAAKAVAEANGVPLQISCELLLGTNSTSADLVFTQGGSFNIVAGGVFTPTGAIRAPDMLQILKGSGRFALGGVKNQRLSVCWYGACDGSADVADNLRLFFSSGVSNKDVVFPPANYNLCTSVASGYPAFNNYSIGIVSAQRIKVDATNATFTTCAAIAQSTQVQISESSDIIWDGGNFVGTRSGLATGTVNNPFGLMNTTRLRLRNARALSGFGDNGAMFEGDFNKDFVIEDNIGYVGQGVDMAFSLNGVYRNNQFRGTVGTSTYGVGPKCMSHIYDGPMVGQGTTGFTQSENVKFIGNTCDNYITGVLIQEGRHIQVHDNFFKNIVGATGQPASGVLINYVPSGDFANVGHTPWNVSIRGNHFDGLGTTVAGCAVNFGANAIANADVFNRFIIDGNMMSGSASSSGICSDTTAGAKLANVFIGINEYSNLAGLMNANMNALDLPATLPR